MCGSAISLQSDGDRILAPHRAGRQPWPGARRCRSPHSPPRTARAAPARPPGGVFRASTLQLARLRHPVEERAEPGLVDREDEGQVVLERTRLVEAADEDRLVAGV